MPINMVVRECLDISMNWLYGLVEARKVRISFGNRRWRGVGQDNGGMGLS